MSNNIKKFFSNKKNIIIILLSSIVIILVILLTLNLMMQNINKKYDTSNMTSEELIEMFEKENYEFKLIQLDNTLYIVMENANDGITIQRIPNTLVGTLMTFKDEKINDEMADILDTSDNDTKDKEKQYNAYINWLNDYNITKLQLCNILDYYKDNNLDKIEYKDTTKLFNNN